MTLADEMIEYRAKNRISQRELAKRAGVTLQTIWYIENGKVPTKITEAKVRLAMKEEEN